MIRCLFEIGHIICCYQQITVGWFAQLLVSIMVGWSLSRQDVNRNDECTENGKLSAQKTVTTVHKNQ